MAVWPSASSICASSATATTLVLEPFRAGAFPVLQDLEVDRSALDRIIAAGGYCSLHAGSAPDANAQLIGRDQAALAFDAATCIGCGACVAACPNASASLFTAAKLAQNSVDGRAGRMAAGAGVHTIPCGLLLAVGRRAAAARIEKRPRRRAR